MMRIDGESLYLFCRDVCLQYGFPEEDACTTATVLTETDLLGTFSHGTKNLRGYMQKTEAGGIHKNPKHRIITEGPGYALMDADAGIGMTAGVRAMRCAIEKAKETGIAIVNVRNSTHFGAAGYYACMAAKEDMLGVAMSNTEPNMSIPGGKGHGIGNSPLAVAFPNPDGRPIFLDIALSSVAALKILKAADAGQSIPDSWAVNAEGFPTTDPQDYLNGGAAQPMAGYKGYGLSVMVEILTGLVSGGKILHEMKSWNFCLPDANEVSHSFIAVDIHRLIDPAFYQTRLRQYYEGIHGSPLREGSERVFLPGEIENTHYADSVRDGIVLPDDTASSLRQLSEESGIPLHAMEEDV